MKQREKLGLLDNRITDLHCTPAYVSALEKIEPIYVGEQTLRTGEPILPGPVKLKNVWFRAAAQMFSDVSPEMHEEFEFQYMRKLSDQCGLVYYGCCEALHNKIHLLKKIPNMRKIGVSPWANVRSSAEQIGGDYVYAHKPNPAHVSGRINREAVEREISGVIDACLANKCPYEFVLKDISTVSYRPQNLFEWNTVVQETIDKYYK